MAMEATKSRRTAASWKERNQLISMLREIQGLLAQTANAEWDCIEESLHLAADFARSMQGSGASQGTKTAAQVGKMRDALFAAVESVVVMTTSERMKVRERLNDALNRLHMTDERVKGEAA